MAAFPEVSKIQFEGPDSKNPLAFRHYNENEVVEGKTMKEHLRFSVVYWHTFRGTGADPFGAGMQPEPPREQPVTEGDLHDILFCHAAREKHARDEFAPGL